MKQKKRKDKEMKMQQNDCFNEERFIKSFWIKHETKNL